MSLWRFQVILNSHELHRILTPNITPCGGNLAESIL